MTYTYADLKKDLSKLNESQLTMPVYIHQNNDEVYISNELKFSHLFHSFEDGYDYHDIPCLESGEFDDNLNKGERKVECEFK
jgi:hypothetical protein